MFVYELTDTRPFGYEILIHHIIIHVGFCTPSLVQIWCHITSNESCEWHSGYNIKISDEREESEGIMDRDCYFRYEHNSNVMPFIVSANIVHYAKIAILCIFNIFNHISKNKKQNIMINEIIYQVLRNLRSFLKYL